MIQKVPQDGVCTNTVDRRAQKLVDNWTASCQKLKDLKPEIEWVREAFKTEAKGSQTILGCRNFKEFCTKHLKKTEQGVYAMLGDYNAKAKAKREAGKSGATVTTVSTTLAQDSVERLKEACDAASQHFEFKQKGKEAEAKKMEETFHSIAKAETLPSPMFSVSQRELMSDFIAAQIDLYEQIEKAGERVPLIARHVMALRKRFATVLGNSESQPKPDVEEPVTAKASGKQRSTLESRMAAESERILAEKAKAKDAQKETAPAGKADAATVKAS